MFRAASTLRGRVRIDMPQSLARAVCIPRLPELLAAHPRLELQLSTTDRRVDVIREGFDCVLRVGKLTDSGLTARRDATSFVLARAPRMFRAHEAAVRERPARSPRPPAVFPMARRSGVGSRKRPP
jgi:DNA-binding transcriptional LysR family regulator